MVSSCLEVAGLICITIAALLVSVPLGLAVAGVALLFVARGVA